MVYVLISQREYHASEKACFVLDGNYVGSCIVNDFAVKLV